MQKKLLEFCDIDETTKKLIQLYCQTEIQSSGLAKWFDSVQFDALPSHLTCMAASACSAIRFADVPQTLVPRLRGIVKYVHTLNSGMFSAVCLLATVCNRAQIPLLLLEDTALYMCYGDAPQRHLWQVCVGVHATHYEEVLQLAQNSGFSVERHPYAAVARQGITQQIVIRPTEADSYLWNGTTELKKGNAVCMCPQPASMLVETCQRMFRAFTKTAPQASLVRWCMDMKVILSHFTDADWACAEQIAQAEKAKYHVRFLLAVYEAIAGVKLKETLLFGSDTAAIRTVKLLQAYIVCSNAKQKLRHTYLLYRLRRPDSIIATMQLLIKCVLRKWKMK